MFERLSNAARDATVASNVRAHDLRQEAIAPEHILLGVLDVEDCHAARLLRHLDRDPAAIAAEIAKSLAVGIGPAYDAADPNSPRISHTRAAKKVIEYAIEEARTIGDKYVGTQHLLLGVLRTLETAPAGAGIVHPTLRALNLSLETIRAELEVMMSKKRFEEEP